MCMWKICRKTGEDKGILYPPLKRTVRPKRKCPGDD
ncbi:hypothetical protein Rumal_0565 [Ruminococcus albus 7 = DSM 20455]|uniref:Uncharacterized protein n=1 Tax=Ruminococcus albus (strain ATCC 27210 / DSM 20455 / JCM 14654 / NCDO 2250 / 7) TaxID=697329 RepID=E6UG87_RUMA7|nr:hypothetical protein Rumal_0565 [Ruminococcus albus 7 = DSM 20455]